MTTPLTKIVADFKVGEVLDYAKIDNPFYRAAIIDRDGRGNFGKDVPAGLVYYSGHCLTPKEPAQWLASDRNAFGNEDALGLGYFNS